VQGFVFKSVFGDDLDLCRELLELSLGTRIRSVELVQAEREVEVAADRRAGRLDLLVVDGGGRRYDVEVQSQRRRNELLRARHYQALMDVDQLRRGTEVENLRDSVVVFVCDFDPLGRGLRLYDCRTTCVQTEEAVPDGRRIVMLNSRGTEGEVPPSLGAFLRLVAGEDVRGDPFVDRVSANIEAKVSDPRWMGDYMDFYDELEAEREAAREEGRAKGMAKGLTKGRAEAKVELAARMVRDGLMNADAAADFAGVDADDVRRALCRTAQSQIRFGPSAAD
jgi:predicted transposase/invertase (TIGR01784 family)